MLNKWHSLERTPWLRENAFVGVVHIWSYWNSSGSHGKFLIPNQHDSLVPPDYLSSSMRRHHWWPYFYRLKALGFVCLRLVVLLKLYDNQGQSDWYDSLNILSDKSNLRALSIKSSRSCVGLVRRLMVVQKKRLEHIVIINAVHKRSLTTAEFSHWPVRSLLCSKSRSLYNLMSHGRQFRCSRTWDINVRNLQNRLSMFYLFGVSRVLRVIFQWVSSTCVDSPWPERFYMRMAWLQNKCKKAH